MGVGAGGYHQLHCIDYWRPVSGQDTQSALYQHTVSNVSLGGCALLPCCFAAGNLRNKLHVYLCSKILCWVCILKTTLLYALLQGKPLETWKRKYILNYLLPRWWICYHLNVLILDTFGFGKDDLEIISGVAVRFGRGFLVAQASLCSWEWPWSPDPLISTLLELRLQVSTTTFILELLINRYFSLILRF